MPTQYWHETSVDAKLGPCPVTCESESDELAATSDGYGKMEARRLINRALPHTRDVGAALQWFRLRYDFLESQTWHAEQTPAYAESLAPERTGVLKMLEDLSYPESLC